MTNAVKGRCYGIYEVKAGEIKLLNFLIIKYLQVT